MKLKAMSKSLLIAGLMLMADRHISAQPSPNTGVVEVKWDEYIFQVVNGRIGFVFDKNKKQIGVMAGDRLLVTDGHSDVVVVQKSVDEYKVFLQRGGGANPSGTTPSSGANAPAVISFDDSTSAITVPMPDGVVAVFIGEDVKISGFHGQSYILRHQTGHKGRFMEGVIRNNASGTLSGAGEEFLREGGGVIYDSGMGTGADMQTNKQVLIAKQLSQIAMNAVTDVRKIAGHENFKPAGYEDFKRVSEYRLRSDGSR